MKPSGLPVSINVKHSLVGNIPHSPNYRTGGLDVARRQLNQICRHFTGNRLNTRYTHTISFSQHLIGFGMLEPVFYLQDHFTTRVTRHSVHATPLTPPNLKFLTLSIQWGEEE
jgi:hypothetical protein